MHGFDRVAIPDQAIFDKPVLRKEIRELCVLEHRPDGFADQRLRQALDGRIDCNDPARFAADLRIIQHGPALFIDGRRSIQCFAGADLLQAVRLIHPAKRHLPRLVRGAHRHDVLSVVIEDCRIRERLHADRRTLALAEFRDRFAMRIVKILLRIKPQQVFGRFDMQLMKEFDPLGSDALNIR